MPAIIKNEQQVRALNEIAENLSTISSINSLLDGLSTKYDVQIVASPSSGKGRAIRIGLGETEAGKISSVLLSQKQRLTKAITTSASKNKIDLDDDDKATMGLIERTRDSSAPEDADDLEGSDSVDSGPDDYGESDESDDTEDDA